MTAALVWLLVVTLQGGASVAVSQHPDKPACEAAAVDLQRPRLGVQHAFKTVCIPTIERNTP